MQEAFPRALIFPNVTMDQVPSSSSLATPAMIHALPIAGLYAWVQVQPPSLLHQHHHRQDMADPE